jgi:hypothetical protein
LKRVTEEDGIALRELPAPEPTTAAGLTPLELPEFKSFDRLAASFWPMEGLKKVTIV